MDHKMVLSLSYDYARQKKGGVNEQSHFDSHGGAVVQYHVHLSMKEVQGFHKSH